MTLSEQSKRPWRRVDAAIALTLAAATIAAFFGVLRNGFINYDDNDYVTRNLPVQTGLSREGVIWAFTTTHSSNWHPLTWLSHMADCSVYGLAPAGHHLTNLELHLVNSVLLFLALRALTGARWRAALVAALFALHPLHVESVAWIAERKDVLSTAFWMLTLLAYAWYAARRTFLRYAAVFVALLLGLLAKSMLVTLPCVLLLLDYWPLDRLETTAESPVAVRPRRLVLEKLPLFALALGSCLVTLYAQKHGGAMPSLHELPLPYRLANAIVSYVLYIEKMVYPVDLAVYYPHTFKQAPFVQAACSAVALLAVSGYAVWCARRRPYFLVGWLWFLGTLLPVIGVVQVGGQALADRYTYVPIIGLYIIIAWGAAELVGNRRAARIAISGAAVAALLALTLLTRREVSYWRTTETLFTRAEAVTKDNVVAHNALGLEAMAKGDFASAAQHLGEALRLNPSGFETADNYGVALAEQERYDEAIALYKRALELNPRYPNAHNNWGNALLRQGQFDEAISHYTEALRLDPEYADALNSMGAALISQDKPGEAVAFLTKAVTFAPAEAQYRLNLAVALDLRGDAGDEADAIASAREALRLDPKFTKAVNFLKMVHAEP